MILPAAREELSGREEIGFVAEDLFGKVVDQFSSEDYVRGGISEGDCFADKVPSTAINCYSPLFHMRPIQNFCYS